MLLDEYNLTYPSVHPGTERTNIKFLSGMPDLKKALFSLDKDLPPRLFVTDNIVASLPPMQDFLSRFDEKGTHGKDSILILETGEENKNIDTVLKIIKFALNKNYGRNLTFVGIGGGVITDMTAFAASIFKRGAKVELVPTTLLAMVDAAIGGKTGCDFDSHKNMIGTFFPASVIYIYPEFVKYLPESQFHSGLGEVIKTALLYSESLYSELKSRKRDVFARKDDIIEKMINTCVRAKANIVEQDFTEQNVRRELNLGHTFGHALETISGLGVVPHGDAVAWGISRALELGCKLGLCHKAYRDEVFNTLKDYGWENGPIHSVLLSKGKSNEEIAKELIDAMKKDKKNVNDNIRFVLQTGPCATLIKEVPENKVLEVLQ
ncbi:MAG: 3-dehydroquinate synthase [Treponema sp.]|nr:3-dehydroquinate synthase [Treponema sp.]